jgi:hypothetical protein
LLPPVVQAQSAGRSPQAGDPMDSGVTLLDNENRVSSAGVLRLWQAYSSHGARAMLKVFRPEGSRLVLVGSSALVTIPAAQVTTMSCAIPVARNDLIGVYCPDTNCVDRFADGQALSVSGDVGTEALAAFVEETGTPAISAGTAASLQVPSSAGKDLVVPVAARNPGVNGSQWITALEIFNPANHEVQTALFFNRSGEDNTVPAADARVLIPARSTVVFDDVLNELFELDEDQGSIDIISQDLLIAHARIANVGSGQGSFGQLVPAQPVEWALGDDDAPGINPNGDIFYLFELREDAEWRSNVGLTNTSGLSLVVELNAFVGTSVVGEPLTVELKPYSHRQLNRVLATMGVSEGTKRVRLNVAAQSGSTGRFLTYASRVDNTTGDAVFLPGAREPSLDDGL